ncbi:unnamed protein product [Angiostrongylus costaricensis]|uniref:Secreted glypican-1 n=1 Tax=Angiostrongylus costaricensis TaxID=334426 RepID=A0A158PD09_ANGCS|nr:unnamed protein product [Angiostrongylus costaricensis]
MTSLQLMEHQSDSTSDSAHIYTQDKVNATKCDCRTSDEENKTRDHLRLVIRISALKLLPTVREIIYQSEAEKSYLLLRAKYEILKDLRVNYGNLLAGTNIMPSVDVLIDSIRVMMNDNQSLTLKEMHLLVTKSVSKFHATVLPTAFLCFALGTCRMGSSQYMSCMRNNVQQWTTFLGDDPLNIAKKLADFLHRYKGADNVLQAIHTSLITAENEVTSECARRFNEITVCLKCLTDDTVGYCRNSCLMASFGCLENLAEKWDANVDELYELTRNYKQGFEEVGIKQPRLARVIVSRCGPLLLENISDTSYITPKPRKPKEVELNMEKLVEQMRQLRKCWRQIAERMCSAATTEHSFCWNGTSVVRIQLATDDFNIETKDVRPRPKEPWLEESSGYPYDTDDEDYNNIGGGSGSGMPFEEVDEIHVHTMTPGECQSIIPS